MSIWIRYTEYKFVQPKQIPLADYNQLRNNYRGFINNITTADKELFLKNYKFKIFLGPIILLLCFLTWGKIMEIGKDWIVVFYIILAIIGVKCFGYILSSLSILDNIQNKKRFYKGIKEVTDKSSDYNDFQKRLMTWNKKRELGFTQLAVCFLILIRNKDGFQLAAT